MQHLVKRADRNVSCRHCWDYKALTVPAQFSTHTEYVINRNGDTRHTWRVYYVCELHARGYAERHGLELPE